MYANKFVSKHIPCVLWVSEINKLKVECIMKNTIILISRSFFPVYLVITSYANDPITVNMYIRI